MTEQVELFASFETLWDAVVRLQKAIDYSYVEALGETLQNIVDNGCAQQIDGKPEQEVVFELETLYKQLNINQYTPDERRKIIQYAFLKAAKEDQLQLNHQMTPEAIALLIAYMVNQLVKSPSTIIVGDLAVGTGNLLASVLLFLQQSSKTEVYGIGVDNDEVLLHLASQAFQLEQLPVEVILQDSLTNVPFKPFDVAVCELPVGYYPVDERAANFQTAHQTGHSFAHHLLIEQHIRYLKPGGIGIFIVPLNLFETEASDTLLSYLQKETYIQASLALPTNLFKHQAHYKSLLIVQKKGKQAKQVSQVLLGDIPELKNIEKFTKFIQTFEKWSKEVL